MQFLMKTVKAIVICLILHSTAFSQSNIDIVLITGRPVVRDDGIKGVTHNMMRSLLLVQLDSMPSFCSDQKYIVLSFDSHLSFDYGKLYYFELQRTKLKRWVPPDSLKLENISLISTFCSSASFLVRYDEEEFRIKRHWLVNKKVKKKGRK